MTIFSLFDGISCGMVAFEKSGISVERYAAYEIDKYAKLVSGRNYPQIEAHGDVITADFTRYKGFDMLIGGSPCTYWSVAKNNREITPDGIGGQLFMHYVRALNESGCKWFLYENNYSIHKNIKAFISKQLGVEAIMINSALVSAQQRKRCYWTNIPNITQPNDKGLLVQDILQSDLSWQDKSYCMKACYHPTFYDTLEKHRNTMVAEPIIINAVSGKSRPIKAQYTHTSLANATRSDRFGATMVAQPIPVGYIGNSRGQGNRVYSVRGKSVCLSANGVGGGGVKTGLYKIDLPDGDYIIRKLTPTEAERLQTLPDRFTEGISDTQRYKCIGNGWTVDVISHILSFMPNN